MTITEAVVSVRAVGTCAAGHPMISVGHAAAIHEDEQLRDCKARPHLDADSYVTLAKNLASGAEHPFYGSGHAALMDVLSDVRLAHMNEITRLERRVETAEADARYNAPAVARAWRLVYAAGKRKTMQTADVRAALSGD